MFTSNSEKVWYFIRIGPAQKVFTYIQPETVVVAPACQAFAVEPVVSFVSVQAALTASVVDLQQKSHVKIIEHSVKSNTTV